VVWEVGVADPDDPTWVLSDIHWSTDPDVWEAARAQLAQILIAPDAYGIPAWWKVQYFGATNGTNTSALEDWDHDGMNNYAEWKAGTVPTNAVSCLRITHAELDGANLAIQWQSVTGKWYSIQRSTNLSNGFPLLGATNIAGVGGSNVGTVQVNQATEYYRVKVE
jgi:hypothetical protein